MAGIFVAVVVGALISAGVTVGTTAYQANKAEEAADKEKDRQLAIIARQKKNMKNASLLSAALSLSQNSAAAYITANRIDEQRAIQKHKNYVQRNKDANMEKITPKIPLDSLQTSYYCGNPKTIKLTNYTTLN